MEVPKRLMRKKSEKDEKKFGKIKFGSSPFASKMSASTNQFH